MRSEDSRLEGIVNEFLDKYFLNTFDDVHWIKDKGTQVKGVIFSSHPVRWGCTMPRWISNLP